MRPTRKFAIQLTSTAMDIAAGRGPWLNNSAVIIHGMGPGPTEKKSTNDKVATTATYWTHSISSYIRETYVNSVSLKRNINN